LLLTIGTACFSHTWTITNSGYTFSPATITITLGDSVNFSVSSIHQPVEVSQATWNANGNTPLAGGFQTPFGGGLVLPAQLTVGTHYYVCSAHASMGMKGIIIVQNTTGIIEYPAKINFSVYPNPSHGQFQVVIGDSKIAKNYNLEVYDLAGNKIYGVSDINQQTSINLDLSDSPSGIYFIRLYDGEGYAVRKIVIR